MLNIASTFSAAGTVVPHGTPRTLDYARKKYAGEPDRRVLD
jgi:hypothetical protein